MSIIDRLLSGDYMPHGHCLLWQYDLLIMHVGSDLIIAVSYFSIPLALLFFIYRKRQFELNWTLALFACFILFCGMTHVMEIVNVWNGYYYAEGAIKVATALVSAITAIVVWPLLPKITQLPSFNEWRELTDSLQNKLALSSLRSDELTQVKAYLEEQVAQRTEELQNLNRRLERENIERRLAEERANTISNAVGYGLVVVNSDGLIQSFNSVLTEMLGYAKDELKQQPIELLLPESIRHQHQIQRNAYLKRPETRKMGVGRDLWARHKNGGQIPVEVGLTAVHEHDSHTIIATVIDITERKRMQEQIEQAHQKYIRETNEIQKALKESEAKFRTIAETLPGVVWMSAPGLDRIYFINRRYEEIWGRSCQSLYENPRGFIDAIVPEDRDRILKGLERHKQGEWSHSYRIIDAWGSLRYIEDKGHGVLDDDGRLICLIGMAADVTEQIKHKEALLRSNQELDDFAYIASHDLKEPLRGISNYASFLIEDYQDRLDDSGRQMLQSLVRLTSRMERLITELLHYSRLGRTDLSIESCNLNTVVTEVIETLEPRLNELAVNCRIANKLPEIKCDRVRVAEVFRNLITNSMKYNDKEEKWITVGSFEENVQHIFYVKDNGIGISSNLYEKIFKIFKRLHPQDKYGGTGVGLTIVKKIVERHGGRIWLDSSSGEGTTFYFTLDSQS
ncbi:sensor histidine kinase [Hahella sp. NBU794]|uniref:sensor histidine kinase n=1 Tax=Hahella sp. NBU794 TaxID=3422590 RepID=UPI003D6FC2A7